jgi:hypothetical protein
MLSEQKIKGYAPGCREASASLQPPAVLCLILGAVARVARPLPMVERSTPRCNTLRTAGGSATRHPGADATDHFHGC